MHTEGFAMKKLLIVFILLLLTLPLSAQDDPMPVFVPEVINTYDHDNQAFTQGLLYHNGFLYESTGRLGQSSLRQVDPLTGEVLKIVALDDIYFAEGLELVGDQLIQLTWTAGEAFVYDVDTFELIDTYTYEGQGWGLCLDGDYLYMGDGTSYLSIREADTFDLIFRGLVTFQGNPLNAGLLNELECVGDIIYANAWQTQVILMLDKTDGRVIGVIDTTGILTQEEYDALDGSSVLNGIAYNPETETFFITGKNWNKLFEVRFVPRDG